MWASLQGYVDTSVHTNPTFVSVRRPVQPSVESLDAGEQNHNKMKPSSTGRFLLPKKQRKFPINQDLLVH